MALLKKIGIGRVVWLVSIYECVYACMHVYAYVSLVWRAGSTQAPTYALR